MDTSAKIQISLDPYEKPTGGYEYDLDKAVYDLNNQIELLTPRADYLDYFVAVSSGLLCSALDILWTGGFDLRRGRAIASSEIENVVKKTARIFGCKKDDLKSCITFLEKKFPIPSDGNTADFGGGRQHHLRDFAHHPTLVGLIFSLLTQFTGKSYGTDTKGKFLVVEVPEKSRVFIGDDAPTKILYGTLIWFFHLVSDIAGSSGSAGKSEGTGIPGPLLALAKEISALPLFKNIKMGENSLPLFLSKLFNGTLFIRRDDAGKIIKESVFQFDFRSELGIGEELGRQAVPVLANECMVRVFYSIRQFGAALEEYNVRSFDGIKQIPWREVYSANNPTLARMLVIATGVFTTVDVGEAIISQKYWVAVNYAGVGRFSVAIGQDVAWCLRARNLKKIRRMYEDIRRFAYMEEDNRMYGRIGSDVIGMDKFGLTVEQTEILYNLEYFKTLNDIRSTRTVFDAEKIKRLKVNWLEEWKGYMTQGFSRFLQIDDAELHWYSEQELIQEVRENQPSNVWFRLVLLETMLFEPYFPLSTERDKKGNIVPSKKYQDIQNIIHGYKRDTGDRYLDALFSEECYYPKGYMKRLRKCYDKTLRELNEVLKTVITSLSITAVIAAVTIATAGTFAPAIAVTLVGSNFAGLSGAALTSACLAYLGGGAIAVGGAGMAGGTIAIVGGGAILGLGAGAGVGGAVGAVELAGKKNTILQSAKLLVAIREIFLNDEHDLAYSNSLQEQYVKRIQELEANLTNTRLQADVARRKDKRALQDEIKKTEESIAAMKIARKNMVKFISSFETGMLQA